MYLFLFLYFPVLLGVSIRSLIPKMVVWNGATLSYLRRGYLCSPLSLFRKGSITRRWQSSWWNVALFSSGENPMMNTKWFGLLCLLPWCGGDHRFWGMMPSNGQNSCSKGRLCLCPMDGRRREERGHCREKQRRKPPVWVHCSLRNLSNTFVDAFIHPSIHVYFFSK